MDESTRRHDWPSLGRRRGESGETRLGQNVLDDLNGFLDQRVELNQEIQGKVAERQELFFESGECDAAHGVSTFSLRRPARLCGASAFDAAQFWYVCFSRKSCGSSDIRVSSVAFESDGLAPVL